MELRTKKRFKVFWGKNALKYPEEQFPIVTLSITKITPSNYKKNKIQSLLPIIDLD